MYVVTNRVIHEDRPGLDKFGRNPNPAGPNELRLLCVDDSNPDDVSLLDDELTAGEVEALANRFNLDIDRDSTWYQSLRVACELYARAQGEKKPILLYVHGYNNDIRDVLGTARDLEKTYGLIALPFTWPANGGGSISGTAAYLGDKDDARCSATALQRVVSRLRWYHGLLVAGTRERLWKQALARHPLNQEQARALFDRGMARECNSRVSLLCHSMGNYVLKHAFMPSNSALRQLAFDNVSLVAADVNNPGHADWVSQIPVRNRLFIVINENDGALVWSRRKPGEEQLPRLGHHLKNLNATNAYYIDVTRNTGVKSDHSYFRSKIVDENKTLKRIFAEAFSGEDAEKRLEYQADLNVYRSS